MDFFSQSTTKECRSVFFFFGGGGGGGCAKKTHNLGPGYDICVKITGNLMKTSIIKAFCHLCSEIWMKISR